MRYRTYEHRNAEAILNANFRLKKEIEQIIAGLELRARGRNGNGHGGEALRPHLQIQRAFLEHGWEPEVLVSARAAKRQYFDLYKDRVAIEIELSSRELLYRDYYRFQMADAEGRLDVGIILLLDDYGGNVQPLAFRGSGPRLEDVADDLHALRSTLDVPVWAIALY